MRRFQIIRDVDSLGVTGTGLVAEGVLFTNGKVVISWLTPHSSTVVWDTIEDWKAIGGAPSVGQHIIWIDQNGVKP